MKEAHFRIRNLTSEEYQSLKKLAKQNTGKSSIAQLAKQLLMKQLGKQGCLLPDANLQDTGNRIEVRLQSSDLNELRNRAFKSKMTANKYLAMLFQAHIQKTPVVSTKQIESLYQSNAQMLRIGRNLNQIAKALNSGAQAAVSTQMLANIKDELDKHTEKVADVIQANWERMP
ncbi:plasmid mobilization relaxosome protein MobC [Advenella sp. WQ 585]|uniref:Plasmid mobilization relaxosome protein MobC n=1 Tax=Advenella mandrilli TaxID=2800330 RepID=A0ABS1EG78_9BURK|nr:plasmid mobilization relaxosome protein MobC [Advenella mandrilli]MBK1781585.1 plasmid mobilization relaxosome protein MobC [Advenella mandrilli]